jgi:hypothetical protein
MSLGLKGSTIASTDSCYLRSGLMDYYQAPARMQQTSPFLAGAIWNPGGGHSALPWQELVVTFGFITAG